MISEVYVVSGASEGDDHRSKNGMYSVVYRVVFPAANIIFNLRVKWGLPKVIFNWSTQAYRRYRRGLLSIFPYLNFQTRLFNQSSLNILKSHFSYIPWHKARGIRLRTFQLSSLNRNYWTKSDRGCADSQVQEVHTSRPKWIRAIVSYAKQAFGWMWTPRDFPKIYRPVWPVSLVKIAFGEQNLRDLAFI